MDLKPNLHLIVSGITHSQKTKMPRSHIPPLSPNDLAIALQRIDRLAIDPASKRQLKSILKAASNPDTNKIETIIRTLPKARQEEIRRIFDEIAAMHKKQTDDGNQAVLLLALVSLGTLILSHLLTTDQEQLTAQQLLQASKRVWVEAIQDEIDYCGCNRVARQASGADLAHLEDMANNDAHSIIATYNRDVQRELTKIHEQYPDASKDFYISHMREWAAKRSEWKSVQIAANLEFNTREYARSRFREENYPEAALYHFIGPIPVCKICVNEFAAGYVDLEYVKEHACPRHIGCPHQWQIARKPKIDCSNLWLG